MSRHFRYKNSYVLNRDLGVTIKQIRNKRGLKQIELAEAAGVSRTYICEIENGKRNPTVETLTLICTYMCVPVSEIFLIAEDFNGLSVG